MTTINTIDLEVVENAGIFELWARDSVVLTVDGSPAVHPSESLMQAIRDELDGFSCIDTKDGALLLDEPCLYRLLCVEIDGLAAVRAFLDDQESLPTFLASDPLSHTVPGPEQIDQRVRYQPVCDFLADRGLEHRFLMPMAEHKDDYVTGIRALLTQLSPSQQAVFGWLWSCIEHGMIAPLCIACRGITSEQFAMAVMAGQAVLGNVFGDVKTSDHRSAFKDLKELAQVCVTYLQYDPIPDRQAALEQLIGGGESKRVEFKSTLRHNLHRKQHDNQIVHAALKTIAAFLNSDGGDLLIGVNDDGKMLGLDNDDFKNTDKMLLFLMDKVKATMGQHAASLIDVRVSLVDSKEVCHISCPTAPKPIFLKAKSGEEHLYVRTGPSTTSLNISEAHEYIFSRFAN